MQLVLKRSQKSGGLLSSKVSFALDARVQLTAEEKSLISKYAMGKEVVYDSEARKKHAEAASGHFQEGSSFGAVGTVLKTASGLARAAMMALSLRITIDSLVSGHHIECKDLGELLGAEAAIVDACRNLKEYLDTALTFDGREVLVEF